MPQVGFPDAPVANQSPYGVGRWNASRRRGLLAGAPTNRVELSHRVRRPARAPEKPSPAAGRPGWRLPGRATSWHSRPGADARQGRLSGRLSEAL